ncbi:MAG: outer membrane protein assembly factor BamB family protein [bacterium JZ-2024 1]
MHPLFYFLLLLANFGGNTEHTHFVEAEFQDLYFIRTEAVAPLKGLFTQPLAFPMNGDLALAFIASRKGNAGVWSLKEKKTLWQKDLPRALLVQQKGFCLIDSLGVFPAGLLPFMYGVSLSNGKVQWSYPLDEGGTLPLTDGDGIYFADGKGGVYRLSPRGEIQWKISLGEGIDTLRMAPALTQSVLAVVSSSGNVWGILAGTGKVIWKYSSGQPFFSGILGIPGRAFLFLSRSSRAARLHFLDLSGKELWSMDFPFEEDVKEVLWNSAFASNGKVVFFSVASTLYSVDLDGNFLFKQKMPGYISGILAGTKGLILSLAGKDANSIMLVDSLKGEVRKSFSGEDWFPAPPIWVKEEKLVVAGNSDGKFYLFTLSR